MCRHVVIDGTPMIICGGKNRPKFCACGREASFECDWKVKTRRSGTCDAPICDRCALQVGPEKHLCRWHQHAWKEWQQRHPGYIAPPDYGQLSLVMK